MQLLIPSAKIVSEELQTIGKLPAIIYPVNQGIVFDYLFKQYDSICSEINVICYERAAQVHQRLENYSISKLHIIDLPSLGDLGHSIYYGLANEHVPVIINFADTIVSDNIYENELDSFYYAEDFRTETWTYFSMNEGIITEIIDKQDNKSTVDVQEKLFVGVFSISDSADFRDCLVKAFSYDNNEISSFYRALQMYSEKHHLQAIKTDRWYDIGHIDKYYNSKLEVKAREFNHIVIDKNRGILRKTSDDKDKFIGEIKWYLKLPKDVEYVRPRVFSYSTSYENPYVSMEYYSYHTVHELFLYGDLSYQQWVDIFKRIRFVCNDFSRYKMSDANITRSLEDMYLTKTIQRFEKLKKDKRFIAFFEKNIVVNGKKYISLNKIITLLKIKIPQLLYDIKEFNIIHGDLCFANIMIDGNFSFIKVIDPRGKFGDYDIYGDFRYELAKLFHSIDGKYDFIIKDLFSIKYDIDQPEITFRISDRKRSFDIYQLFTQIFSEQIGNNLKNIELIEALLFLSMIPLHNESINHQMAMLGTGIEILNRVICIDEKYRRSNNV